MPSGAPLGFVAILGVLALIGILIRNSVILIVQIEDLVARGQGPLGRRHRSHRAPHEADRADGTAASLALIPIAREVFWGPIAYAMMGASIAGTRFTLLFLPALYVTWFRIKEPKPGQHGEGTHSDVLAEDGAA